MDISRLSYEDALKELEEIISYLEKEDYSLNEAMDNFKNGIQLYKHCNALLTKAEGEIKILLGDQENVFEDIDLIREVNGEY